MGLFSGLEASSRAISQNMALLLSARRHSTRHSLSTSRPTTQQIFSFSASKERLQRTDCQQAFSLPGVHHSRGARELRNELSGLPAALPLRSRGQTGWVVGPEAGETPLGSPGWASKRKAGAAGRRAAGSRGTVGLGGADKGPLRDQLAPGTMGLVWVAWAVAFPLCSQ